MDVGWQEGNQQQRTGGTSCGLSTSLYNTAFELDYIKVQTN